MRIIRFIVNWTIIILSPIWAFPLMIWFIMAHWSDDDQPFDDWVTGDAWMWND